jgi:hypothetical protein
MQWFDAFLYIFNKHWNKVDNFRIDKFLMFLRFQLSGVMSMLKENKYRTDLVSWFTTMITRTIEDTKPD